MPVETKALKLPAVQLRHAPLSSKVQHRSIPPALECYTPFSRCEVEDSTGQAYARLAEGET